MKRIKIEKFRPETLEIYNYFKQQSGSEHIAKPTTIEILLDICREQQPKKILELGGGIGTISYLLLSNSTAQVDIYEDNDFCFNKLEERIFPFGDVRFKVIKNYHEMPPAKEYDLVIVDGGSGKGRGKDFDGGYMMAVSDILKCIDPVKTIYVEGYRHIQRWLIFKVLRKKYTYKLIRYDETSFQGKRLSGGLKIECKFSQSKILRLVNFIFWAIVEWYPVRNFISYRFKKLIGK